MRTHRPGPDAKAGATRAAVCCPRVFYDKTLRATTQKQPKPQTAPNDLARNSAAAHLLTRSPSAPHACPHDPASYRQHAHAPMPCRRPTSACGRSCQRRHTLPRRGPEDSGGTRGLGAEREAGGGAGVHRVQGGRWRSVDRAVACRLPCPRPIRRWTRAAGASRC